MTYTVTWSPPPPIQNNISGRKVPPSVADVADDNPPVARRDQTPINNWWLQQDPVQQTKVKVLPAAPSFISSIGGVIQAVMLAWQVVAPQPVLAARLNPAILDVRVDNPPVRRASASFEAVLSSWRAPDLLPISWAEAPSEAVALVPSQPGWQSGVIAAWRPADSSPIVGARLSPAILAVPENSPPSGQQAKTGNRAVVIAAGQLNPSLYTFTGGRGLFAPSSLPPSVLAVQEDSPPPGQTAETGNLAAVVAAWQPDQSKYTFTGGLAPFAPRTLPPSIVSVTADNPPLGAGLPEAILSAWVAPAPAPILSRTGAHALSSAFVPALPSWLPSVVSAWKTADQLPGLARRLDPSLLAISVDDPPAGQLDKTGNLAAAVAAGQPDKSLYTFIGGRGPFVAGSLPPPIASVQVNDPPSAPEWLPGVLSTWLVRDPAPVVQRPVPQAPGATFSPSLPAGLSGILRTWEPVYQPTVGAKGLSPDLLSVPVNNPPFGRAPALTNTILAAWKPADPQLIALKPGLVQDQPLNPPQTNNTNAAIVVSTWAIPDRSPVVSRGPVPAALAVPVDAPPPRQASMPRGAGAWFGPDPAPVLPQRLVVPQAQAAAPFVPAPASSMPAVLAAWVQPSQIFAGRNLSPAILAVPVSNAPFGRSALDTILAAWRAVDPQPVSRPGLVAVQAQAATAPYLNPTATAIASAWAAPGFPAALRVLLNPSLMAVRVDDPPAGQQTKTSNLAAAVAAGQPDPSKYTFLGGRGPFTSRTLPPTATAVQVDDPPRAIAIKEQAVILAGWPSPDVPRQASRYIPQGTPVFVPAAPNLSTILAAWQQAYPAFQPARFLPPQDGVFIPAPAQAPWLSLVLSAWTAQGVYQPVAPRLFNPPLAVDNPPFGLRQLNGILSSWELPDHALVVSRPVPSSVFVPYSLGVDPEYLLQYPDTVTMIQYPDTETLLQYPDTVTTIQYP